MKKVCIILVVILLFSTCVHAATNSVASTSLDFSGTTATCTTTVNQLGASIDITMSLYRGTSLVKTWTKSGANKVTLSKTRSCISGQTYTLEADVTVNGVSVNVTPITKTCP